MSKFGVCMTSTKFYPFAGGAEKQAERLARWLIEHDVPVMMVTRQYEGLSRYEELDGIKIFRVPSPNNKILGAIAFIFFSLLIMLRNRKQYDIIHCHQIYSPTTIGWIAARLLRKPLIVNLHLGGAEGDIQRLLRNRIGAMRLNILKRDADAFIAISREIAQEMREQNIPEEKIHFLVNAVDPQAFCPVDKAQKQALRQELGIPADIPVTFFGGRLEPIKGVQDLLAAWTKVPEPALLVIAGTGSKEQEFHAYVEQHLPGRVLFVGKVDNISDYLQACDVWTLPSYGEGLPVSLIEAMSAGISIVTTPVGAIAEIIKPGENGFLVQPGDQDALAKALQEAMSRSDAVQQMVKNARQVVLDQYSLSVVCQGYLDLFENLLHTR